MYQHGHAPTHDRRSGIRIATAFDHAGGRQGVAGRVRHLPRTPGLEDCELHILYLEVSDQ